MAKVAASEFQCVRTISFAAQTNDHRVATVRGSLAGGAGQHLQFGNRQVLGAGDQADQDFALEAQRPIARPDAMQGRQLLRTDAIAQEFVAPINRLLQVRLFHRIAAARSLRRGRREEFENAQRFRALRPHVMPSVLAEEQGFTGQAFDRLAGLRITGEHRTLQDVEDFVRGKHSAKRRRMLEPATGRQAELEHVKLPVEAYNQSATRPDSGRPRCDA